MSSESSKHQHTSACYSSKWANSTSNPCPIFAKNRLLKMSSILSTSEDHGKATEINSNISSSQESLKNSSRKTEDTFQSKTAEKEVCNREIFENLSIECDYVKLYGACNHTTKTIEKLENAGIRQSKRIREI